MTARSSMSRSPATRLRLWLWFGAAALGAALLGGATPAAAQATETTHVEAGTVREVVEQVLADEAFRRLRRDADEDAPPGWIERFWRWLEEFLGDDDESGSSREGIDLGFLMRVLTVVVVCVIGVVLALLLLRIGRGRSGRDKQVLTLAEDAGEMVALDVAPGEHPAAEYLARARRLAASGDCRGALRETLLACMSAIERRGLVRHRRGLTNRDYLRAVRRDVPRQDALAEVVRVFESVHYGRRTATAAAAAACIESCERQFGGADA